MPWQISQQLVQYVAPKGHKNPKIDPQVTVILAFLPVISPTSYPTAPVLNLVKFPEAVYQLPCYSIW